MNLGGTGEIPEAINVNPHIVSPRKDIPNLVMTGAEELAICSIGGSVDSIISNRLPPNTWIGRQSFPAPTRSSNLVEGLVLSFRGAGEVKEIEVAMKAAKFQNIKVWAQSVVEAVK